MRTARPALLIAAAMLTGACGDDQATIGDRAPRENDQAPPGPVAPGNAVTAQPATGADLPMPTGPERQRAPLLGESIALAQWRKAANRATCAPLALTSDAGAGGVPRPATFSGGWAVAFDQPDRRSAYGVAGVSALPEDRMDFALLVDRLARQWPYVRRWDSGDNLPAGSAAGYGLEGFADYPPGSSGFGRQSVAYLRIPGQSCLYNVWSRLGRDHLERLLSELAMVRP